LQTRLERLFFHFVSDERKRFSCHCFSINFKVRSRVFNLKDKKNPELRENVLCGVISPDRIATMTSEEMASQEVNHFVLFLQFSKSYTADMYVQGRERLRTVNLVLTSLNQLLFILKLCCYLTKQPFLMRRSTVLGLPLQ